MEKKRGILVSVIGILSLVLVTVGISLAFFNYVKLGTTENSITSGTITFLYTEVDKVGAGIKLENAIPITDAAGKMLTGSGNVFNFKVTSTTNMDASIPYEVTARMKEGSDLDPNVVKVYLTKGETEEEVLLEKYGSLTQTSRVSENVAVEKTIYTGRVPSNTNNYEETFKLRMWVDEKTDYSPVEKDGEIVYPYNNKTFTLMVNVYADAKVLSQEEVDMDNSTKIETVTAGDTTLTEVTGEDYRYETTLPEGTTSTTLNIQTENPNSTVEIERIDSLAMETSKVKRLSIAKTVDLIAGDNYFKITVTSENGEVKNQYTLKIHVDEGTPTLSSAIFSKYTTIYENPTLTDSSNNTSDASGLYKSTATNSGDPTYYFRGNVENYLDFAGFTWRVVRINEDGTIRIVMQDGINDKTYKFNSVRTSKDNMYYSNSDTAKSTLDAWYNTNIASNVNYSNRVVSGNYFCEEAKVVYSSSYASNSGADMKVYNDGYTSDFTCEKDEKDGNGKGFVNASVGLLTYDEVLHAGGYYAKSNSNYYLYNSAISWWTMSPAGFSGSSAYDWRVSSAGDVNIIYVDSTYRLRAVLNLKADTTVTGLGTSDSHWAVAN